ncbi:hypothetical protein P7H22_26650 [Paenibacillus larvae]|nr:hypothetical protein [Paenibacillus larvae]MDT2243185.1 hypothetical protein [Paenibacillus larvae]
MAEVTSWQGYQPFGAHLAGYGSWSLKGRGNTPGISGNRTVTSGSGWGNQYHLRRGYQMIDIQNVSLLDILPPNLRRDPTISAAAKSIDEVRQITVEISTLSLFDRLDELTDSELMNWPTSFM